MFEECFCNRASSISQEMTISTTIAFLEFFIVSVSSQKTFVNYVLGSFDLCNEIKRNFQILKDLDKENINLTPLSMLFHILCLYEQLVNESKKYPNLALKLIQDTSLFNSAVETVQKLLFMKKETFGFEFCIFTHSYALLFRILTSYLIQKSHVGAVEAVFNSDLLENFLHLSGRIASSESTIVRLQDIESQLIKQGFASGISEFLIFQSHKDPSWKLFESNSVQYGQKFKYNTTKLSLIFSSQDVSSDLMSSAYNTFTSASSEASLIDSQLISLNSFKTLLAYVVSFGYSGKPQSALHNDISSSEIKPLLISSKKILHENLREAFEIISIIAENI